MKRLDFTRHARTKMEERAIDEAWVDRAARQSEWTEPEPNDPTAERRFAAIPEFGNRVLRVVCVETANTIRVITALFDRGARRKEKHDE